MNYNWPQIAAGVYQACCTYDQYLPKLNAALARSWGRVFAFYELSPQDLLAGVEKLYRERGSGFRPLPGDIAAAARAIREDQPARLPLRELQAHYESKAARIAGRIVELPEAHSTTVEIKYHRPACNPLLVACPHCRAVAGRHCSTGSQLMRRGFHPSRMDAAEEHHGADDAAAEYAG